jgi:hypothetical protein
MKRSKSNTEARNARFVDLRKKLIQTQGDLLAQYQREARDLPLGDAIAATRLKLVYRQKGLKI